MNEEQIMRFACEEMFLSDHPWRDRLVCIDSMSWYPEPSYLLIKKFLDEPWPHDEWGMGEVRLFMDWMCRIRERKLDFGGSPRNVQLKFPAIYGLSMNLYFRTLQRLSPSEQAREINPEDCDLWFDLACFFAGACYQRFTAKLMYVLPEVRRDQDSELLSSMIWICRSLITLRHAALLQGEGSQAADDKARRLCERRRESVTGLFRTFQEVGGDAEFFLWEGVKFRDPFLPKE